LIPVALDQRDEPLGANLRGGDLRFHVADDEVGDADVVTQQLPYSVVADAAVVHLDGFELEAFGIGVDGVDNAAAARAQRADIETVSGRRGERYQPPVVKKPAPLRPYDLGLRLRTDDAAADEMSFCSRA